MICNVIFNKGENKLDTFCQAVLALVNFAILIWGSVVVFGAWATWTDDYDKYKEDTDGFNYCKSTPMKTAFNILIFYWVS